MKEQLHFEFYPKNIHTFLIKAEIKYQILMNYLIQSFA